MRRTKIISVFMVLLMLLTCFGCNSQQAGDPNEEPKTPDAETAMNNFLTKLTSGNYVVEPSDYVKTTVQSPEVVYITDIPGSLLNVAFVTLNGETFQGYLDENEMTDIEFYAPGKAIDAVADILPNNWINIADGNIWNLFYNNVSNPLEFTSKDENVKTTLLGLAGYSNMVLEVMEEVHMELDKEDPSSVHFTAAIGDMGMYHYDDLDVTLKFGTASSDARIEKWLKNPTYPERRAKWDVYDIGTLDNVFMRDYGEIAVPFPEFASYALIFDSKAYSERREVELHDAHATEKNVEDYVALLLSRGYEKVSLDNGDTGYRLLLREEKKAYAELEVSYDNGFALVGRMHYETPSYEGIAAINEPLRNNGFAELKDTDVLEGWMAVDSAVSRSEGWLYYFNYDLYLQASLTFSDREAAEAYFEEYGDRMKKLGYSETYAPNGALFENGNGFRSFTYMFSEEQEGLVQIVFKNERSLTADEVNSLIREYNLPEANVHGDIGARDHTTYYHNLSGFTGLNMIIYQPFDTMADAEAFLDSYTAYMEELGYDYVNPQTVGSYRNFAYFNEQLLKYVGFDLMDYGSHAMVTLEYNSSEPEEKGLSSLLGR